VIACQGGGSHTAFTAGVLKRVVGAPELAGYEIAGLSGTSGGAVCALLAWSALRDGDPARAGQLLEQFWIDNSAREPADALVNSWVLWASAWQNFGVPPPMLSPYHSPASIAGAEQFRQMLRRQVDSGSPRTGRRCAPDPSHTACSGSGTEAVPRHRKPAWRRT
jgi:NTE family protein